MLINDVYELERMETQHAIDTDMFQLELLVNDLTRLMNEGNASLMEEHAKLLGYLGREFLSLEQGIKECV